MRVLKKKSNEERKEVAVKYLEGLCSKDLIDGLNFSRRNSILITLKYYKNKKESI